jgi:uncharacterized protein (DUF1697 family)
VTQVVAFLRGINVGGHNLVKKEKLREAFASLGFSNVEVHKQSGNVIFETDPTELEALQERIKGKLRQLLGINVKVFVRTMSQLEEIVGSNPFKDLEEEGSSFLVTFAVDKLPELAVPFKIPNSTAEIILIKGSEAYSITRGHGDGAKPNPFIESKFKTQATTRNLNIIKEITETYPKPKSSK